MEYYQTYIQKQIEDLLLGLPYFAPEILLSLLFIIVIITDLVSGKRFRNVVPGITIFGLILSGVLSLQQLPTAHEEMHLFSGMLLLDTKAVLFKILFTIISLLIVIFSIVDFQIRNNEKGWGEYFVLIIGAQLAMHLMAMSSNLLMVFLSVEMLSICSYILVAYVSRDKEVSEAGMKYILFGAATSAIMLFGISLLYGFTGTLNLFGDNFLGELSNVPVAASTLAILFVFGGLAFKLSMVPFHLWVPDAYQGAATPITAFLSTAAKAAGFALLIRFISTFTYSMPNYTMVWPNFDWETLLIILSILTMTVGNFGALWQDNIKRMLAYSSIGHTGFLLMGVITFSISGEAAILFYLLVYSIANIGAFLAVGVYNSAFSVSLISEYKGLGPKMPWVSAAMVVFLISLVGLPPTAGFVGKFFVFSSAFEAYTIGKHPLIIWLMVAGVLNTVVSLYYYFKVPLNLYLRKPDRDMRPGSKLIYIQIILVVLAIATILIGIFPGKVMNFIELQLNSSPTRLMF